MMAEVAVAEAVGAARELGVAMATVHTLGGSRMMEAAVASAGTDFKLVERHSEEAQCVGS
jgi:orotidine-5'-phosphate decarboxylase